MVYNIARLFFIHEIAYSPVPDASTPENKTMASIPNKRFSNKLRTNTSQSTTYNNSATTAPIPANALPAATTTRTAAPVACATAGLDVVLNPPAAAVAVPAALVCIVMGTTTVLVPLTTVVLEETEAGPELGAW